MTSALLNAVVAEDLLPGPVSVFLPCRLELPGPVRPGDTITAEVEILEVRADKSIYRARTTVTDQDGTVVSDGGAVVYRVPLPARTGRAGG